MTGHYDSKNYLKNQQIMIFSIDTAVHNSRAIITLRPN